jgi:hypothetical protein
MKSLAFLFILLCAACALPGSPTVELSPTLVATQSSITPTVPALSLPSPTPIFDIAIDNVVIDRQGQLYASGFGDQDDLRHFARWEGGKWIELGHGFKTAGNSLVVDSAGRLYTESLAESGQGVATAIMRWNGVRWEEITGNFGVVVDALQAGRVSSNIPVMALAVDGEDNLYAAGQYYYPSADNTNELPMGYVAKWNKESWTVLGQGLDMVNIYALAASATGKAYVSGEQLRNPEGETTFRGFIAQWDGEKWTQPGMSKLNSCLSITHIALEQAGGMYASCSGSEPGELIFYWDGRDWITITTQLGGEAPAVYDMQVDKDGQLCIGGSFTSVSNVPAQYIACWDGASWRALGDSVNERVNALAFDPGGELYAVGFFTEAGGLPADHAARWDGKSWHTLGNK